MKISRPIHFLPLVGFLVVAPFMLVAVAPAAENAASALSFADFKKFRDPFKAPDVDLKSDDLRSDLEKFPVTSFRLVAVMTGPAHMRAMLAGSNNKVFTVATGTRIGLRDGKVKRITTKSVIVQERIVNPLGEAENVDTEILFPPEPTK